MKILLEYDQKSGILIDKNGISISYIGLAGFDIAEKSEVTIELIKQGVTPDEIIKLKNQDLI